MAPNHNLHSSSAHLGLAESLPVVAESTTSRVLISNSMMRVVQFTFDTGQLLSQHSTPRAVSCLLNEGRMLWTLGTEELTMSAGDVIYLAPGQPHALVAEEPSRLTLTMVEVDSGEGESA
ncbi:cupin domain-containing protein [Corynebacterium sp. H128]|uniref:cupin domain-containing protein n=1 Tax=unclassified Corynebacterium TaxID=2624378 RepID=UPI0030B5757B